MKTENLFFTVTAPAAPENLHPVITRDMAETGWIHLDDLTLTVYSAKVAAADELFDCLNEAVYKTCFYCLEGNLYDPSHAGGALPVQSKRTVHGEPLESRAETRGKSSNPVLRETETPERKQEEMKNILKNLFKRKKPIIIKFIRKYPDAKTPKQGHFGDAGYDFYVHHVEPAKGYENVVIVYSGICVEIPYGYQGELRARSSVYKTYSILSNGVGTIDAGYRGEVRAAFYLNGNAEPFKVGERFAQLVIMPAPAVEYVEVEKLSESERGEGGYGSTGK